MSAARRQSPHVPTAAERFGGGDLIDNGVVRIGFSPTAPKYCPDCGSPYPWASAAIETLEELAMLDDESDEADRTGLVSSAEVAMSENPKTNAAALDSEIGPLRRKGARLRRRKGRESALLSVATATEPVASCRAVAPAGASATDLAAPEARGLPRTLPARQAAAWCPRAPARLRLPGRLRASRP